MAVEDSRIFTLNASNAIFYGNSTKLSNLTFFIPKFLARHSDHTAVYLSIENITLPSSWYNVDEGVTITLYDVSNNSYATYTLPAGNYDAFTLTTQINTYWLALGSVGLQLTYSLQKNKFGIEWKTGPGAGSYQLTTNNQFIFGLTRVQINPSSSTAVYFEDQVDLTGVNSYLIVCDECPTQNYSLQLGGNIIGCIQNAAANFGVTIWQNASNLRYLIPTNRQIDQISIRIYNERGEFINFNGTSWSITLKVTYVKDKGFEFADFQRFIHEINRINPPELQNHYQNEPDAPVDSEQQPVAEQ